MTPSTLTKVSCNEGRRVLPLTILINRLWDKKKDPKIPMARSKKGQVNQSSPVLGEPALALASFGAGVEPM